MVVQQGSGEGSAAEPKDETEQVAREACYRREGESVGVARTTSPPYQERNNRFPAYEQTSLAYVYFTYKMGVGSITSIGDGYHTILWIL